MLSQPTEAEFALLLSRAGLTLDAACQAELPPAWARLEAWLRQLRAPLPGEDALAAALAEPATTFDAAP
ncbi:MAG TPA: hypothetical protein VE684_05815 [Crenalkalicoccus sp.]|jgi:hypothetical protein|nr:hypothetical protein [Crenalkalicoccus sp.]